MKTPVRLKILLGLIIFVVLLPLLSPIFADAQDREIIGKKGKKYTIDWGINLRTKICVKMYKRKNKEPATAKFWVWEYFGLNKRKLGTHTGKACFKVGGWGLTYKLRVGSLRTTTVIHVFHGKTEAFYKHKFKF